MIYWQMDEWWPCPRCGCADRDQVSWNQYELTWVLAGELPDGSEPTFRRHFEYRVSFECAECKESGREVMATGATR